MTFERFLEITGGFGALKIAVAGDLFLDRIFMIDRSLDEPSVETGLTAYQVVSRKTLPGAAGVVTNNLSSLGVGEIYSLGIMGDDGESYDLLKGLAATGVRTEYMVRSDMVFTPTYTKTMFDYPSGIEETHRIDIRNRKPTPAIVEKRIIDNLYGIAEKVDAIIALEQLENGDSGVFTSGVVKALSDIARKRNDMVVMVDSRFNVLKFRDVITKCNDIESVRAMRSELYDPAAQPEEALVDECVIEMPERSGKPAFVSQGDKGMKAAYEGVVYSVPPYIVDSPIDICGAGDSATAGIACALSAGASPQEAALIGNLVASITIQQLGVTGTANIQQLTQRFGEYCERYKDKEGMQNGNRQVKRTGRPQS